MDIKKFKQTILEAIDEGLEEVKVRELAKEAINTYNAEIINDFSGYTDALQEAAEANDYTIYDDYLTLNVKGRPVIEEPLRSELLEKYGEEAINNLIDETIRAFTDELSAKYEDAFGVLGRSGGYWGFKITDDDVAISDEGYNVAIDDVIKQAEDWEDYHYKEYVAEANEKEIASIFDSVVFYDTARVVEVIEDVKGLEFKPEFLAKMTELSEMIDEKEKEMNNKSFYDAFLDEKGENE